MAVSVDGAYLLPYVLKAVTKLLVETLFLVSFYGDAAITVLEEYCCLAVCSFVASVQAFSLNTCQNFSC